jgi:hypothetical protein
MFLRELAVGVIGLGSYLLAYRNFDIYSSLLHIGLHRYLGLATNIIV